MYTLSHYIKQEGTDDVSWKSMEEFINCELDNSGKKHSGVKEGGYDLKKEAGK